MYCCLVVCFFFSSRRRHTRSLCDWSSDVCSSDLVIGQTTFAEVAPWVFHQADGQETVVFRADPNGMLMLRSGDPVDAFVKVAWYDTPSFHLGLLVACMIIFLSALLLWPLGFVRR